MAKLPEGLKFPGKGGYTVGKCIGTGAQGVVHEVLENGRKTKYVVKLTIHPKQTAGAKKKKKSAEELNVGMLRSEYQIYLSHLREFRGDIIPDFPGHRKEDVPTFGDIKCEGSPDWRFLVIERMHMSFFDIVDKLFEAANPGIGPILVRMVEILQRFHEKGYVFVDCKPDNFMLASPENNKKRVLQSHELASLIRWLDLAMVARLIDSAGKRVENTGISALQGTPLYASLHVHDLNTPSRRDDLFAIGIVLSELIIRTHARVKGTDEEYESTKFPSYLPWALESSSQAVGEVKRAQVLYKNSEFYRRMPPDAAAAMYTFLTSAHSLGFKDKPTYDDFKALVTDVNVPLTAQRATGKAKTPPRKMPADRAASSTKKKNPASKRTAAESAQQGDDNEGEPVPGKAKAPPRKMHADRAASSTKKKNPASKRTAAESAQQGDDNEGEPVPGKAKAPPRKMPADRAASSTKKENPASKRTAAESAQQGDDNEGEPVPFTVAAAAKSSQLKRKPPPRTRASANEKEGEPTPFTAAAAAKSSVSKRKAKVTTTADDSLPTHRSSRLKRGLEDNEEKSPPARKAGKTIHIDVDDVVMEDAQDDDSTYASANSEDSEAQAMDVDEDDEEEEEEEPSKPRASSDAGIKLIVTEGPDKGAYVLITKGQKQKDVVLGSNPSIQKGQESFKLTGDRSIGSSHAMFKGIFGRFAPSCSVDVTDLGSSGNNIIVDGKKIPSGSTKNVHRNNVIRIGETAILVVWWDGGKENVA